MSSALMKFKIESIAIFIDIMKYYYKDRMEKVETNHHDKSVKRGFGNI